MSGDPWIKQPLPGQVMSQEEYAATQAANLAAERAETAQRSIELRADKFEAAQEAIDEQQRTLNEAIEATNAKFASVDAAVLNSQNAASTAVSRSNSIVGYETTVRAYRDQTKIYMEQAASYVVDLTTLNGHPGSFYQNADNLNAGTVSGDRLPKGSNTAFGATSIRDDTTSLLMASDGYSASPKAVNTLRQYFLGQNYITTASLSDMLATIAQVRGRTTGKLLTTDVLDTVLEKTSSLGFYKATNMLLGPSFSASLTTLALTVGRIIYIPVFVPRKVVVTGIMTEITAFNGGAAVRLALMSPDPDTGGPGLNLASVSYLGVTENGVRVTNIGPLTLSPGQYFVAIKADANPLTLRALAPSGDVPSLGFSYSGVAGGFGAVNCLLQEGSASGQITSNPAQANLTTGVKQTVPLALLVVQP